VTFKEEEVTGLEMVTTDEDRVLRECRDVIVYPLFLICSKSLKGGKIPLDWKLAEVTAIFK